MANGSAPGEPAILTDGAAPLDLTRAQYAVAPDRADNGKFRLFLTVIEENQQACIFFWPAEARAVGATLLELVSKTPAAQPTLRERMAAAFSGAPGPNDDFEYWVSAPHGARLAVVRSGEGEHAIYRVESKQANGSSVTIVMPGRAAEQMGQALVKAADVLERRVQLAGAGLAGLKLTF